MNEHQKEVTVRVAFRGKCKQTDQMQNRGWKAAQPAVRIFILPVHCLTHCLAYPLLGDWLGILTIWQTYSSDSESACGREIERHGHWSHFVCAVNVCHLAGHLGADGQARAQTQPDKQRDTNVIPISPPIPFQFIFHQRQISAAREREREREHPREKRVLR